MATDATLEEDTSTYGDEQKAFRWQLTSIVPSAADIVDNANKKLFHSAFNPTHCLNHMLPPYKKLPVKIAKVTLKLSHIFN